jgi:isoquinoline 1-oxidoreductase beta subunit
MAGAAARQMLREATAAAWSVPIEEITTEAGTLYHKKTGKIASYGQWPLMLPNSRAERSKIKREERF